MGQKIHPRGFRVGVTEDWRSRWYAPKAAYGEFLIEDQQIRKFIDRRCNQQPPYAAVSDVDVERTRTEVKVILHTGRPGLVIGPRGAEVEKLREELEELIDRKVEIKIVEVKSPDTNAQLVAEGIAEGLKKRGGFRRVIKQRCEAAMGAGAKGIKVHCSGRLAGAEMARRETQIRGTIPLHTLQAHIDYGYAIARTTYGTIGVKVWVYHGRYGEEGASWTTATPEGRREGRRGKRG